MDEGIWYLSIALLGVLVTLSVYVPYLARRGRVAWEEVADSPDTGEPAGLQASAAAPIPESEGSVDKEYR